VNTYIALIRGINVGGNHPVPMSQLRDALSASGLRDVTTYIQSGNVLADSKAGADEVARIVEEVIAERFGVPTVVMIRTPTELARAVERHPFRDLTPDRAKLHVFFCAREPDLDAVAALDHTRFAPDLIAHDGMEFFGFFPNGMGRTKLVLDERSLGTPMTARNLNTVVRLIDLAHRRVAP
jgi:uncharacterized protein (DUF1697 family)